jgi:hypothetical protein
LVGELQLLRVFLLYRANQHDEARQRFAAFVDQSETTWLPVFRAKALMFGQLFALVPLRDDSIERLLRAIERVSPPTARLEILEWCPYSNEGLFLEGELEQRLRELFNFGAKDTAAAGYDVSRADLLRLLGERGLAAELLADDVLSHSASTSALLLRRWEFNRARQRLSLPTRFKALWEEARESRLQGSPLLEAMCLEAAHEMVETEALLARRLLVEGFPRLMETGPSCWTVRVQELEACLVPPDLRLGSRYTVASGYRDLGDEIAARSVIAQRPVRAADSFQLPETLTVQRVASQLPVGVTEARREDVVTIVGDYWGPGGISASTLNIGTVIDKFMENAPAFLEEMSSALRRSLRSHPVSTELLLDPRSPLECLPWELTPFALAHRRVWRTSWTITPRSTSPGTHEQSRVVLVQPLPSTHSEYIQTSRNFRHASSVTIVSSRNTDISEPQLIEALRKEKPTLLHITASVRENYGGVCLDLKDPAFPARETVPLEMASDDPESYWSPSRLARVLSLLPDAPVVVLDIQSNDNLAESIRRLLLRNLFATQLFQLAPVRAILGIGLMPSRDGVKLTGEVVRWHGGGTQEVASTFPSNRLSRGS